jgi:hypothetical protein
MNEDHRAGSNTIHIKSRRHLVSAIFWSNTLKNPDSSKLTVPPIMVRLRSLLSCALLGCTADAVPAQVDLASVSYIGTPLENGLTQWMGMRYAAPPVGDLRFMPPEDPPSYDEPQPADTVSDTHRRRPSSFLRVLTQ